MLKFKTAFTALILIISSELIADNKLTVSDGVKILAINGKEYSRNFFSSSESTLNLSNGTHQVLVQYELDISSDIDDSDLEQSDPFVLLFPLENNDLLIKTPSINSLRQLKAFNNSGNWILVTSDGKAVNYQKSALKKSGFQLARDYERELADFNNSSNSAALNILNETNNKAELKNDKHLTPIKHKAKLDPKKSMAIQMLKHWYNSASKEEKNQFKAWLNKQNQH